MNRSITSSRITPATRRQFYTDEAPGTHPDPSTFNQKNYAELVFGDESNSWTNMIGAFKKRRFRSELESAWKFGRCDRAITEMEVTTKAESQRRAESLQRQEQVELPQVVGGIGGYARRSG